MRVFLMHSLTKTLDESLFDAFPHYDITGNRRADKIRRVCAIGEFKILQRNIAPELGDVFICLQLLCVCQL